MSVITTRRATLIRQFIQDINWKRLIGSVIIALITFIIANVVIDLLKGEAFRYAVNKELITLPSTSEIQARYNSFSASFAWIPVVCLAVVLSQYISCRFLMEKVHGVEYTNAIALALFTSLLVYNSHPLYSVVGFVASLATAHKVKPKKKGNTININDHR